MKICEMLLWNVAVKSEIQCSVWETLQNYPVFVWCSLQNIQKCPCSLIKSHHICETASGWCSLHSYRFLGNVSQASRPGSYRFRPQSSAGFWPLYRFSVAEDTSLKNLWPSREHNRTHWVSNSHDDFINETLQAGHIAVYLLIDVLGLEAFLFGVIAHLSEPLEEERVGAGGHRPLPTQTHCFRWHEQTQPGSSAR